MAMNARSVTKQAPLHGGVNRRSARMAQNRAFTKARQKRKKSLMNTVSLPADLQLCVENALAEDIGPSRSPPR